MIGKELTAAGRLIENKELMLVHLCLKASGKVPAHDHVGQDIFFTVVKGVAEVTLNGNEVHRLEPGAVLQFPGETTIAVEALTDMETFIYLINRRDAE